MFGGQGNKFTFGQTPASGAPAAATPASGGTSFSFGGATSTPAASTSFSFGGGGAQPAVPGGGGLFGSGTGATSGGLFGSSATALGGGGGASTTAAAQPAFSFGSTATAPAPAAAAAAATSSPFSFGASATANTSAFGSLGAKPAPATTTGGGFSFGGGGATTTAGTTGGGGGLFGQSAQAPATTATSTPSSGGFSLSGASTQQPSFSFGTAPTTQPAAPAATGQAAGSILKPTFSFNTPASTGTGITSGLPAAATSTTTTAAPTFGLSTTQPAATTTTTGTGFGGFSFAGGAGAPTTTTTTTAGTTNPNVKTSLSFGTATATSSLPSASSFPSLSSALGAASTTAPAATNGLGTGKQPGITSFFSSTTTPLKPTTTSTAPTGGLTTGTSLFNLGTPSSTNPTPLGTGTTTTTTTAAADVKPNVTATEAAPGAATAPATLTTSTSTGSSLFGTGSTLKLGTQPSGLSGLGGSLAGSTGLSIGSLSTPLKTNPLTSTSTAPSTPANSSSTTNPPATSTAAGTATPKAENSNTGAGAAQATITNVSQLPNVLTISGPTLSPMSAARQGTSTASGLNLTGTTSATSSASSATSTVPIIKSNLPKDQLVPQMLVDCFENFKKNLEEIKKTKELNASFNNKLLVSNLNDINSTKQRLTQSKIELQRNVNEASKVKSATIQELRNLDICLNLKDMPVGSQYDTEIWNEYFLSRAVLFENKIKAFKAQFEQLEGYFRAHDKPNSEDAQKLVEAVKITHKNLLNAAANLKTVNEAIEELKHRYTVYRRNVTGDMTNIFENGQNNNNQRDAENQQPSFNMSQLNATLGASLNTTATGLSGSFLQLNRSLR